MSVQLVEAVYGITASGKKVKIGTVETTSSDLYLVGGKIFYIDNSAEGAEYHFYNQFGEEIMEEDISIGDSPYAYKVIGAPVKDKYYIIRPYEEHAGTWSYKTDPSGGDTDRNAWDMSMNDAINTGFGGGRTNTQIMLSAKDGVFANQSGTVWNALEELNRSDIISDWYIPSELELSAFVNSHFESGYTDGVGVQRAWSSTESDAANSTSAKAYKAGASGLTGEYKFYNGKLVPIRSF